jgi:hypothetical protein
VAEVGSQFEIFRQSIDSLDSFCKTKIGEKKAPWQRGKVVSSPPAELWVVRSNPGVHMYIGWQFFKEKITEKKGNLRG